MSDSSNAESCTVPPNDTQPSEDTQQNAGVHFLTEKNEEEAKESTENREKEQDNTKESPRLKTESVEYLTRNDGSVVCKLCGEILQSRTHWYRHKYKLHVPHLNPAPLFQCEQCLVFFKSRKGYIGHIASRHSEVLSDSSPVLTNAQIEAMAKEQQQQQQQLQIQQQQLLQLQQDFKEDLDPELAIPKSSVPNYQTTHKQTPAKPAEQKKIYRTTRIPVETPMNCPESEQKRIQEEKLVTDIIDRVRRECEAQGSGGPARRGYSRRTTVMHT
ncbi:uncharacterized protein [Epargyreus clarus]|uniref:uncharacterized protein n=1 Tax=Epargyreus clarus TaxID=520877 RepID=UPI003C2BAF0C